MNSSGQQNNMVGLINRKNNHHARVCGIAAKISALLLLMLVLSGWGAQQTTGSSNDLYQGSSGAETSDFVQAYSEDLTDTTEVPLYWLTVDIPSSWEVTREDSMMISMVPSVGGLAQLSTSGNIDFADDGSAEVDYLLDSLDGDVTQVVSEKERGTCGDAITYTVEIERTQDGDLYKGYAEFIVSGHSLYMFLVCVPEDDYASGYDEVLKAVMSSMTLEASSEPLGSEATTDEGLQSDQDSADGASDEITTFSAGTYRVGTDLPAGEYKLTADSGTSGYWEVTNSSSPDADIVGNDVFDNATYVTVTEGQYLKLNRCTAELVE